MGGGADSVYAGGGADAVILEECCSSGEIYFSGSLSLRLNRVENIFESHVDGEKVVQEDTYAQGEICGGNTKRSLEKYGGHVGGG